MLNVTWIPKRKRSNKMGNKMVADRNVVIRPLKPLTDKLTTTEVRVLKFYKSIGRTDRSMSAGLRFCRSLETVAGELGVNEKTIRRANDHFRALGVLSWKSGNSGRRGSEEGLANQYWLVLDGIPNFEILGVTPAMLARVRRQIFRRSAPNV